MDIITPILLGLIVGFVAAIPLGPINIYVVTNTMKRDFLHGLMGGVTAAVLDIVFCLGALVGIGRIVDLISRYSSVLKVLAALLLTAIGIRLIRQAGEFTEAGFPDRPSKISAKPILAVVLLYVSNPALYGFWLGAAGTVTTQGWVSRTSQSWIFALAAGLGSLLWYFLLVYYVNKHHHQISPKTFRKILVGLAVVLFLFAGFSLGSLLFTLL